jgi:hypothetical protein
MTQTNQPKIAARALQQRTGEPYQRLLELCRVACSERTDDDARRQRMELFSVALQVPEQRLPEAFLLLVWPPHDSFVSGEDEPDPVRSAAPVHPEPARMVTVDEYDSALEAAETVLRWATSTVGRREPGGEDRVSYDAFESPTDGISRRSVLEYAAAFDATAPFSGWVEYLVESWRSGAIDVVDRDSVSIGAATWWEAFCTIAADRLYAACALYTSAWPVLGDPEAEWTWAYATPKGLAWARDDDHPAVNWPPRNDVRVTP